MTILEPGSDNWMHTMTASKVAAVMGYSPYTSPLQLWARMKGLLPPEPDNPALRRGHFLEPAVVTWFFSQHPELMYLPPRTFYRDEIWAANPDAIADDGDFQLPVEAKTTNDLEEWGRPGTDEIPLHYLFQCVWQMFVMDEPIVYVPMLGPFLQFEEYVVERNEGLEAKVVARCRGFMESLKHDVPPPISDDVRHWKHDYEVWRRMHRTIKRGESVEISTDLALAAIASRGSEEHAKARLMEAMGDAQYATNSGVRIARRQSREGGDPSIYWPRKPVDPNLIKRDT